MIRRLMHGKFNNKYSFVKDSKYVTLTYLTPKQGYEDKMKLKKRVWLKKIVNWLIRSKNGLNKKFKF